MPRLLILSLCLLALGACNKVPDACQQVADELSFPYSFATYEAAGRTVEEWRDDLRKELNTAITFVNSTRIPGPPVLLGESFIDGTRVFQYELESTIDTVPIPFGVLVPPSAMGRKEQHIVILLHGHGEDATAPFDSNSEMRNIGGRLLDEGYLVVSVEMRSFGEFLIDGKGHDAYIAGLEDGEFVGQVVLETGQVANAIADLFPEEELNTVAIFGHSFGGYIALHVGALVDRMDFVMSSGHFLPYACINTDFAHAGQDIIAMEGVAEIYDVTALAAPTGANVDLFFGAQDSLFTSASVESFERLEVIYDKLGASGEPSIHVNPSIGHEVDPDAVIAALPAIPGD
jgi:dienelactone hydrolase